MLFGCGPQQTAALVVSESDTGQKWTGESYRSLPLKRREAILAELGRFVLDAPWAPLRAVPAPEVREKPAHVQL